MKTIIRSAIFLILAATTEQSKCQQLVSLCAGSNTVVTAVNSMSLSGTSYSMNPGGFGSLNPNFTVSPAANTTYTLYVTGTYTNLAVLTTSNLVTVQVNALPVTSAGPLSQTVGCGNQIAATATCVAIMPSTNVTHKWYTAASPNAFSVGGQISSYPLSGFSGSVTTFTCVVTDNVTGCSASKTVQLVSTAGNYPSFSVTSVGSANSFTLGCSTRSVTDIVIIGANTVPPGGVITYTLLPPVFTGTNYATSPLVNNYTVNVPGTYTVVVRDNANLCDSRIPLSVNQNISNPNISAAVSTRTLSCFTPSVILHGISNTANVNFRWKRNPIPQIILDSIYVVNTNPAGASVPSATLIDNYTLTVIDDSPLGNFCPSNTVVTMWQNTRPPLPGISCSNPNGPCQMTVALANSSTTGVLPGTFGGTGNLVSILWQAPAPQPTLGLSGTYIAQTPGVYTMTVMDMNNGCASTTTYDVTGSMIKPTAAFVHTITGAVAMFNDVSAGTSSGTGYFWDFGDGTFSIQQNPTHTYLSSGAHLVKLKITNSGVLCADSVVQSVTISGIPCYANSNFLMVPTNTAQVWNAIPGYPWNVVAASWNWGDGSVSNTLYTSHQYSAAAVYNICLSVTVSCVANSTTCTNYSIYRPSQASMVLFVNVVPPALSTGVASTDVQEQLSWNIAPNPNNGEFQLNLDGAGPACITVCDLTGRRVYDQLIETGSDATQVLTPHLPAGMYFVTLESDGRKSTKRMVVNH